MTNPARPVPHAPVCPVSHSKENGTAGHGGSGAGQGTESPQSRVSLKALARQALSVAVPHGTSSGTSTGQSVPEVRDKPDSNSPLRRVRPMRRAVATDPLCPRWCDLSSTLFWLSHRGWPSLDVDNETIAGETQWRAWVSRATASVLLALRNRVADGATPTPCPIPSAARNREVGA
jgi:hypothetical protein